MRWIDLLAKRKLMKVLNYKLASLVTMAIFVLILLEKGNES